jgi:Polysaccharide biosynthesis protein
VLLNL